MRGIKVIGHRSLLGEGLLTEPRSASVDLRRTVSLFSAAQGNLGTKANLPTWKPTAFLPG
jgi:hypothetical protein